MAMEKLVTSQEFLEKFGDIESAGYFDPRFLNDVRMGFSVQRNYPENIRFRPASNILGEVDSVAVIWAVCEEGLADAAKNLIPVRFRISLMSKYRSKYWDYNYDDKNCPTKDSVVASANSPKPLDMDFTDGCFYDARLGKFLDENLNEVSGVFLLNKLFIAHCNSVHLIMGAGIRTKALLNKAPIFFFTKTIACIVWILKNIFGRTLDESLDRATYFDGYLLKNFKVTGDDFIELAGYRAAKPVILLFAILATFICWCTLPVDEGTYLGNLIRSDFLLLIHTVLALAILDKIIPDALFWGLNKLIALRKKWINGALRRNARARTRP
jgi:hypothetical protein